MTNATPRIPVAELQPEPMALTSFAPGPGYTTTLAVAHRSRTS